MITSFSRIVFAFIFIGTVLIACKKKDDTEPTATAIQVTSTDYQPTNTSNRKLSIKSFEVGDITTVPEEGENKIWDLSAYASASSQVSVIQNNPVPSSSSFSTATFVRTGPSEFLSDFTYNQYYEVSEQGYFKVGVKIDAGDAQLQGATVTSEGEDASIEPAQMILKFPLNYQDATSRESVLIEKYTLTAVPFGITNAPVERRIDFKTSLEVVGWGKVVLPQGAIANNVEVLLVKNTEEFVSTYFLNNAPAPQVLLSALNVSSEPVKYVDYYFVSKEFGIITNIRFDRNDSGAVVTPAITGVYITKIE